MLVTGPAASALASAEVRFVNARGGSDSLGLEVTVGGQTTPVGTSIPFGEVSDPVSVPPGDAELTLTGSGTSLDKPLADGAGYTVVALPGKSEARGLAVLRSGSAAEARSKLRVLHAAPELGEPDIQLGGRTIAQGLGYRSDTGYLGVEPGATRLAVTRPDGGDPVLETRLPLAAGTATTVIVAGSGGSEARLIEVNDATVTPAGAPHTGFGGLAERDVPWVLALMAALLAGALGAAARTARVRRSRL